jgi:hypothetical protein
MSTRENWLDFETWLEKNYNENVFNLSWNSYVERSKEYNTARLFPRETETRDSKGIAND